MLIANLTSNRLLCRLMVGVLVIGLSLGSAAWAGPGSPHQGHAYPPPGKIVPHIPPGHQSLNVGPDRYFYHKGIYYRPDPKGFRVVRPPHGMVIGHLPDGFETLVIAGITYFLFAGIYYHHTASGYVVVEAPPEVSGGEDPLPPANGQTLVVQAQMLNVRSGPGLNHAIIRQVRSGQQLIVQGSAPDWYYVRLPDGTFGWVMSRYTVRLVSDAKG